MVTLMKTEGQLKSCRNVLAVNENYICYSVKKNLLRVINTITTEKTLLRGKMLINARYFLYFELILFLILMVYN